ncbi:MAG: hypothetical protein OHK006_12890 [Thermodesulfovibrionales bacterium]
MGFERIYQRQPYQPIVLRDLLVETGIPQHTVAARIGVSEQTLRVMTNRGHRPRYRPQAQPAIEKLVAADPDMQGWLRSRGLQTADIWTPSETKEHRYMINHGERIHASRRGLAATTSANAQIVKLRKQQRRKKQIMENGFATLAAFGYHRNPFEDVRIPTTDGSTLKRLFKMAVESNAMVQVIATYGAGKTTAIEAALDGLHCTPIMLKLADKERMGIHDIERGLIRRLSQEPISRDRDARALQVSRVVGEAARTRPVVLIIEEAHCMHHSTLRALKRIREYDWMGRRPLMSVILIGQYDRLKTASLAECHRGMRSDTYRLQGLAPSEARHYISETVGEHFEPEAIKATSELAEARNFLDLQECIVTLMQSALSNGSKSVSVLDVFQAYGGGIRQILDKYDIKAARIAEITGESASTVSLLINNKPHTLSKEREQSAMEAIRGAIRQLTQEHGHRAEHKPHGLKAV